MGMVARERMDGNISRRSNRTVGPRLMLGRRLEVSARVVDHWLAGAPTRPMTKV